MINVHISTATQAHESTSQHRIPQGIFPGHSWSFQRPTPESNRGKTRGWRVAKSHQFMPCTEQLILSLIMHKQTHFSPLNTVTWNESWSVKAQANICSRDHSFFRSHCKRSERGRHASEDCGSGDWKRLFELFMEQEWCFIRGSWNVHGMFKSLNSH